MLSDTEIVVSDDLIGSQRAVQLNGAIFVSPAMWSLLKGATGEELEELLQKIPVLRLERYRERNPFGV